MDYFNPGDPTEEGAWTEQRGAEIYVDTLTKEHEMDLTEGVKVEFFKGKNPKEWWMKRTASDGTSSVSVYLTMKQFLKVLFTNLQKSGEFGDVTEKAAEFGVTIAAGS